MSFQITTAFVRAYEDRLIAEFQQRQHLFAGLYRTKQSTAEKDFFDFLGPTQVYEKTTRHSDTMHVDSQHSRRYGTKRDWAWSDLIDREDKVRMLIEPQNDYVLNAVASHNRNDDERMIDAFDAPVPTGKDGDGPLATFPAGNIVATGGGGTGMTVAKLSAAKLLMDVGEVPVDGRVLATSPHGIQYLLEDPQVTSSDFNTVRALVGGTIDGQTYMGFRFIQTNRLKVAANIRESWAWHPTAMGKLLGLETMVRIDQLPTKHYTTQVYVAKTFGYLRLLDPGVIQIDINESV